MDIALITFPIVPKRQTELRLKNEHAGNALTASVAVPIAPAIQTAMTFQNACAGRPVTATLPVPRPASCLAEVRFENKHAGNPLTAAIAIHGPLKQAHLQWQNDRAGIPVNATLAFYRLPTQKATVMWNSASHAYATATVCFHNDYKNYITSLITYRYDWKVVYGTVFRYRHRSLVQGGWKICAKNLESGHVHEIGFIPSDDPVKILENVTLPDGDYEIIILTSSLFWKDARDGNIRTISVRPGQEISPLPTIYNLRSSVSLGTRTIQWSASRSEVSDCVFGVWYSSTTPVSTDRPPDTTVWYSPEMTEYQTSFKQTAPCYAAVAVIRTGDEPETGPVKELFLDWSNTPPRAPDDVVVLPEVLPAFDPRVTDQQEDTPNIWSNQF